LAGKVADPAVAVVALEKLSKFRKNCCHARVGRLVFASKKIACGYGFICCVLDKAINFPRLML